MDEAPATKTYLQIFNELWNGPTKMQDITDTIIENISTVYAEHVPKTIYFTTLYHVFNKFLSDISEDELPDEKTGFKQSKIWSMLYDFQRDACSRSSINLRSTTAASSRTASALARYSPRLVS